MGAYAAPGRPVRRGGGRGGTFATRPDKTRIVATEPAADAMRLLIGTGETSLPGKTPWNAGRRSWAISPSTGEITDGSAWAARTTRPKIASSSYPSCA